LAKKLDDLKERLANKAKSVSATEALNGTSGNSQPEAEEVEYERYILNLDRKLIDAIEEYVFNEKRSGKTLFDIKTGLPKKINRSLWARHVFIEALRKAGIEID
jgi:hypothetical protein